MIWSALLLLPAALVEGLARLLPSDPGGFTSGAVSAIAFFATAFKWFLSLFGSTLSALLLSLVPPAVLAALLAIPMWLGRKVLRKYTGA